MKYFTVVLLRPEYLADEIGDRYGESVYVANVMASDAYNAVYVARLEVFNADTDDELHPESDTDYTVVVVFEGSQDPPKLFGWQI